MEENTELNDIILNRGGSTGGNKKIVLAVATLGVILIIVVMLMSTLTPDANESLPQPIPLPEKQANAEPIQESEPLFEEVEIIEEDSIQSDNLDEIAQKLKQESIENARIIEEQKKKSVAIVKKSEPKKVIAKKVVTPKKVTPKTATSISGRYYIQVGSFSKYQPNKKFLDSILRQGYKYKFHKVNKLNKVMVGPFNTEGEARNALKTVKRNIEAGAFLTKI